MSTPMTHLPKEKLHGGLSHPLGLTISLSHLFELMISFVIF
jgi:hypothetical protein